MVEVVVVACFDYLKEILEMTGFYPSLALAVVPWYRSRDVKDWVVFCWKHLGYHPLLHQMTLEG